MSHFYGKIAHSGRRKPPTACATKSSGLTVWAAGRGGRIEVRLHHDAATNKDHFLVWMDQHDGSGDYGFLLRGVVGDLSSVELGTDLKEQLEVAAFLAARADAKAASASAPVIEWEDV